MVLPDLHILRDIDHRIAAQGADIRLHRQEFLYFRREIRRRLEALEAASTPPTPAKAGKTTDQANGLRHLQIEILVRAVVILGLLLIGKSLTEVQQVADLLKTIVK